MVSSIVLGVILSGEPSARERPWIGLTLLSRGACLRVVGAADGGPYARAGGQLNDCIVGMNGKKVSRHEDVARLVAAASVGASVVIERSAGVALTVRLDREPPDPAVRICRGTSSTQTVVTILAEDRAGVDLVVLPPRAILADAMPFVPPSHLVAAVLLRACEDQNGKLVSALSPALELGFGSTLLLKKIRGSKVELPTDDGTDENSDSL